MIHVSRLTKYYGDYPAIRDISFEVDKGQVVGFLGVNGAGKSTTMRILAGYQTASTGEATIAGLDVFWDPVEARRKIGYMPENCPLYPEMRVQEYLAFRAGIKGLHAGKRRKRVGYVLDRCRIADVARQLIGTLSKGYRQRVGLADALLADPPVLILDEPTAGLDPTQIRSTRDLIKELGREHTILLSTHILSEVEMTCDRVIIIHHGQVANTSSLSEMRKQDGQQVCVVVEAAEPMDTGALADLKSISQVDSETTEKGNRLRVYLKGGKEVSQACAIALKQGWKLREVRQQKRSLEDLFVSLVGEEEQAGS